MKTLRCAVKHLCFLLSSCILQCCRIIAHNFQSSNEVVGKPSRVDPETVSVISTALHCKAMYCVVIRVVNQAPLGSCYTMSSCAASPNSTECM